MEQLAIDFNSPMKRPWRNPVLPLRLCACGCGQTTNVVYGRPKEYVHGHNAKGDMNNRWNGGIAHRIAGKKNAKPYLMVHCPGHPRATKAGYVPAHVIAAEKALGMILPLEAIVHHVDLDSLNNEPSNFVICQDTEYHSLIHARQRAYEECGHASWRKCRFCHQYDAPENLMEKWDGVRSSQHRDCYNRYQAERRLKHSPAKKKSRNRPAGAFIGAPRDHDPLRTGGGGGRV